MIRAAIKGLAFRFPRAIRRHFLLPNWVENPSAVAHPCLCSSYSFCCSVPIQPKCQTRLQRHVTIKRKMVQRQGRNLSLKNYDIPKSSSLCWPMDIQLSAQHRYKLFVKFGRCTRRIEPYWAKSIATPFDSQIRRYPSTQKETAITR